MSIWIKICGLRDPNTLDAAIELDIQAVGFVFADSVRQVTPEEAYILSQEVPSHIAKVAVFLRPSQNEVDAVLDLVEIDHVQADWQSLAAIELPSHISRLSVIREVDSINSPPDRFLFEGAASGQGETADWQMAKDLASRHQLILAGGLNPQNIDQAIKMVKPFGLDVSSGVESERGVKDKKLMTQFVEQARRSSTELSSIQ